MFGSNKKKSQENSKKTMAQTPNSGAGINMIVHGTSMEGSIKADNDIRIDGKLEGKLHCKGKLILGPTGHIDGEIFCTNAVIEGIFKGKIHVEEILSVRETARIEGDIKTDKLTVQSGAVFNVNCEMGGQKIKQKPVEKSSGTKEETLTLN